MAQKRFFRNIKNPEELSRSVDFSKVTSLVREVISENPNYAIVDCIVVPKLSSSKYEGTVISTSTVEYNCTFILTEGLVDQLVIERQLRNENGNRKVDFSEVNRLMDDVESEYPAYEITSSIVIEKQSADMIGSTIISKTVGYDCCFVLSRNH